jgi:hypothetical protein
MTYVGPVYKMSRFLTVFSANTSTSRTRDNQLSTHFNVFYPLIHSANKYYRDNNHGCPRTIRELERVSAEASHELRKERICTNVWSRRVGVFSTLTNAYAIVAVGASENFYRCVHLPCSATTAHAPRKKHLNTDISPVSLKPNSKTSSPSATPQSPERA